MITKHKPYSESCDQNKDVILEVIKPLLSTAQSVLEIGSGTGQHAIYFCERMPHLRWQTSDCKPYIEGINAWVEDSSLSNVVKPIELDVTKSIWPDKKVNAIFTANSVHIMSLNAAQKLIIGGGKKLAPKGSLLIYGPFNYDGKYTSESNKRFDQWLKDKDVFSGIKDFEMVNDLAEKNGLSLQNDYEMPANNRILHFIKN